MALCLSLPPFGFWPLALVGLVGLDRLVADQPVRVRFRRGWLVALACFGPSLSWMTALTAPGYVVATVLYAAMLGLGIAAAPPGRGRWLALAGTWTLAELVRWS
jgi:apolipoprotein N-acyltransferase